MDRKYLPARLICGRPSILYHILCFLWNFWRQISQRILSSTFSLSNGVRQGQIFSGILYCFYINELFILLRWKKTGCWINNNYHGIFGYSDDSLLLAPSLSCLQEMLNVAEEYCREHTLEFSTDPILSKCTTKCIGFLKKKEYYLMYI